MRIRTNGINMAKLQKKPDRDKPHRGEVKCDCPIGTTAYIETTPIVHGKHTPHDKIYNLSNITAPLRPLLLTNNSIKGSKFKWSNENDIAFNKIKHSIPNIIENKDFDTTKPTRVRYDASKIGLRACLEQIIIDNWYPISYASRLLNSNKQKYTTKN